VIDINHTVPQLFQSVRRADIYTRWFRTLVAAQHGKGSPDFRKHPLLSVFHPGPEIAQRNIVLRFAGDGTSVTPDTARMIYNKTELHSRLKAKGM
tara:strand:- start:3192 stop:3476 length:285 start_codon:yes stop_codon:yes gene_type:complete